MFSLEKRCFHCTDNINAADSGGHIVLLTKFYPMRLLCDFIATYTCFGYHFPCTTIATLSLSLSPRLAPFNRIHSRVLTQNMPPSSLPLRTPCNCTLLKGKAGGRRLQETISLPPPCTCNVLHISHVARERGRDFWSECNKISSCFAIIIIIISSFCGFSKLNVIK